MTRRERFRWCSLTPHSCRGVVSAQADKFSGDTPAISTNDAHWAIAKPRMVTRTILTLFENFGPPLPEKKVTNGNTNADQSGAGQRFFVAAALSRDPCVDPSGRRRHYASSGAWRNPHAKRVRDAARHLSRLRPGGHEIRALLGQNKNQLNPGCRKI